MIALFKPRGFLSHRPVDNTSGAGTVYEFLGRLKERVLPVGRLDKDAEGLLIMTNDGELASRMNLAKFEVPKAYLVKIDGSLDPGRVKRLLHAKVEDKRLRVQEVVPMKASEGKQWVRVLTTDTQNRLIRRMFEGVGRPVDKIRRSTFAGVTLKGLERGQWRFLSEEESAKLYGFVGMGSK